MKAKLIGYDPETQEFDAFNWSPVLNRFIKPEKRFIGLGVIPEISKDEAIEVCKNFIHEPSPVKQMKAVLRMFLVNWMLTQHN